MELSTRESGSDLKGIHVRVREDVTREHDRIDDRLIDNRGKRTIEKIGGSMKKIILLGFWFVSFNVFAQIDTGNVLLERLRSSVPAIKLSATNYITGVSDTLELERGFETFQTTDASGQSHTYRRAYFCYASGVTNQQTFDVVEQYLIRNPATRNQSAPWLIRAALLEVWPCINNPTK